MDSNNFSVVTYNVLSEDSRLCGQSLHPGCKPEHLNATHRMKLLQIKLSREIVQFNAIACLQEVNAVWASMLSTFFNNSGYDTYTHPGGPVGVMMAWPRKLYRVEQQNTTSPACNIGRLSRDQKRSYVTKYGGPVITRRQRVCQLISMVLYEIIAILYLALRPCLVRPPQVLRKLDIKRSDVWMLASFPKHLRLQMIEFSMCINPSIRFCVANYHAPCAFFNQEVMKMHVRFVCDAVSYFADEIPLVLCGDFNIQPQDEAFDVLVGHNAYGWTSVFEPLPVVTNYTENFKGTLDHMVKSTNMSVVHTVPPTQPIRICPNDEEPSDHLLLRATLSVSKS
jgi:2',5'-phosphodiesterase